MFIVFFGEHQFVADRWLCELISPNILYFRSEAYSTSRAVCHFNQSRDDLASLRNNGFRANLVVNTQGIVAVAYLVLGRREDVGANRFCRRVF